MTTRSHSPLVELCFLIEAPFMLDAPDIDFNDWVIERFMGDFWVFGYGSLMWNPGFEFIEQRRASINGLHRSLCVYSWVHRGTRENPGLVFGLDEGGSCEGVAYKISSDLRPAVINYLRERELVTNVYHEIWSDIVLIDGSTTNSLVYAVDREHAQYAGNLSHDEQLAIVETAVGNSGVNRDYVINTVQQLLDHNIRDVALERLREDLLI